MIVESVPPGIHLGQYRIGLGAHRIWSALANANAIAGIARIVADVNDDNDEEICLRGDVVLLDRNDDHNYFTDCGFVPAGKCSIDRRTTRWDGEI